MTLLKKTAKGIIRFIFGILFLDFFIYIFSKVLYFLSKLLYLKDWRFGKERPLFFKHQINFNLWRFDPGEWRFCARGIYAREKMFPNCKVLDLCCGDGCYSFLFFADIASHIDAIDFKAPLLYAKKYYKHPKIYYKEVNIIDDPLPANDYDIIVWNASICLFNLDEIHLILNKIINSGNPKMILCGMLPKANGHLDHKTEFKNVDELRIIFEPYFNEIDIKEVIDGNDANVATFYFSLTSSKQTLS